MSRGLGDVYKRQGTYFLPEEIITDVREYLEENNYPVEMISKRSMHCCMNSHFKKVQIGNRCLYHGVLNTTSHYDTFFQFATDNLVSTVDNETNANTTQDIDTLYTAFTTWCYADSDDTKACNLSLFEVFMRIKFKSVEIVLPSGPLSGITPTSAAAETGGSVRKRVWQVKIRTPTPVPTTTSCSKIEAATLPL